MEPLHVVDVGSVDGLPSHLRMKHQKILCFDPLDRRKSNQNETIITSCALEKECERKFYVLNKAQNSSIYKPNFKWMEAYWGHVPKRFKIKKEISIQGVRIDSVLSPAHDYTFLKIDTQGSGLNVLQGAEKCLGNFSYIEIELYLLECYENAPLFPETKEFLNSFKFSLVGNVRGNDHPIFNDWVFIKDGEDPDPLYEIYKNRPHSTVRKP